MADTLTKGTRGIAQGRLRARYYEIKEGEKRTVTELAVDEIGSSLRYGLADIDRIQSSTPRVGQSRLRSFR